MGSFQSLLPVIIMLLLIVWVISLRRRQAARARRAQDAVTPGAVERRQTLQRAMEELQINVMEFSRDVEARMDTRIATLQRLILDADERIKRLEELGGAQPSGGDASAVPPIHREVYSLADAGFDRIEIARRTGVAPGEIELILGLRRTRGA